jgi:NhaP-type Na+/H+ or K+/H+ antiporter
MNRVRTIVGLVIRMLIGAAIGMTVVVLLFMLDYLGTSDRRFYFVDHWDAFITVLIMGLTIGVFTGIAWAISSKYVSKQMPLTQAEGHDEQSR